MNCPTNRPPPPQILATPLAKVLNCAVVDQYHIIAQAVCDVYHNLNLCRHSLSLFVNSTSDRQNCLYIVTGGPE